MAKNKQPKPICPYCTQSATFHSSSAHVYGGRDYGAIWHCDPCEAWVGCHKQAPGNQPLGRLANKELRQAKMRAHAAFDPLWQAKVQREGCPKHQARGKGYAWLAKQLGVDQAACHIGMFDVDLCDRVVEVCQDVRRPRQAPAECRI